MLSLTEINVIFSYKIEHCIYLSSTHNFKCNLTQDYYYSFGVSYEIPAAFIVSKIWDWERLCYAHSPLLDFVAL